jgi:uncharacterized protein YdiU (UPF0061 family)
MWTPNTTDAEGRRYCYGNQPQIALWNLARFAEALLPIISHEALEEGLELFGKTYQEGFTRALAQKLGLDSLDQAGDKELLSGMFEVLNGVETDFTLFFRGLAAVEDTAVEQRLLAPLRRAFYAEPDAAHLGRVASWLRNYLARVRREGLPAALRAQRMNAVNPKYVPRNYLAQQAIDAMTNGDASVLERLMKVLERPYDEQPENDGLAERRPEWARNKAGCSALSCSS